MEEPGSLQSMGLQSQTRQSDFTFTLDPVWGMYDIAGIQKLLIA